MKVPERTVTLAEIRGVAYRGLNVVTCHLNGNLYLQPLGQVGSNSGYVITKTTLGCFGSLTRGKRKDSHAREQPVP